MMTTSGGIGYTGWDVHSYSPAISQRLRNGLAARGRPLGSAPIDAIDASVVESLLRPATPDEILDALGVIGAKMRQDHINRKRCVTVSGTLSKMLDRMRASNSDYCDPDITMPDGRHLFVGRTLVWCTGLVVAHPDLWPLFFETLEDIGQTCIQGDSHRLLSLGVCILEDERMTAKTEESNHLSGANVKTVTADQT